MASIVSTNAYVMIDGLEISDHVKKAEYKPTRKLLDASHMGDQGNRRKGGLYDQALTLELYQDEALASINAKLFATLGVEVVVAFREVNAVISATNPEYAFSGMHDGSGAGGTHGEMAMTSVNFVQSDGGAPVRDVTP